MITSFILPTEGIYMIIAFLFFVLTAITITTYFSQKNKTLRTLKKQEFKKILLCKENEYVKIQGKALPIAEPLTSPISTKKCVYYKIEVKEKRSSGKNSSWHTIIKEEKSLDFIIDNNNQKAIISCNITGDHKNVYLNQDIIHQSGTWNDAPVFLEKYLQSHRKESTGFLGFNKNIKYVEGIIHIGEKITVMGIGNWKESDQQYDRYSSQSLFISGNSEHTLLITDEPKAYKTKKK